ncbi:MAG: DUF1971 domain-containing protein [Planctomycetota bacterium]
MAASLPPDAEPVGQSPEFTQDSVPDALLTEHQTAAGRWALLEVLAGALSFVDLVDHESRRVDTGQSVVIEPERPHKVSVQGAVRFRLSFFKEAP